jgi:hypothetical protein
MVQRRVCKGVETSAQGSRGIRGSISEQICAQGKSKGRGRDAHIPPRLAEKRPTLTIAGHRYEKLVQYLLHYMHYMIVI